ncbi:hypothetical protein DL769_010111 [Monosporascus sp. CRB-8-3]|nr:hypothetical protein DL769_010111 [Monosporascus sp. CRB-8-3]
MDGLGSRDREWLPYKYYTDPPHHSFHEFCRGPVLPWARIKYFGDLCFRKDTVEEIHALSPDWWIAPLKARDRKGLRDAFIKTSEVDPVRDECEAYGSKLVTGGNKVTIKRYLGSPHLFAFYPWLAQKEFDRDSIEALREAHCTR